MRAGRAGPHDALSPNDLDGDRTLARHLDVLCLQDPPTESGHDQIVQVVAAVQAGQQLLDALSGGEHGNDLIATGLGRRVTTTADLMVTGKRFFTVQVVR